MNFFKDNTLKNKITIVCFLGILGAIWIFGAIFFIVSPDKYRDYKDASSENRASTTIDVGELWSSGSSISDYIDDNYPFRNGFIKIYKAFNGKLDSLYQKLATKVGSYFYTPTTTETTTTVVNGDTNQDTTQETTETVTEELDPSDPEYDLKCYLAPVVVNDVLYGRRTYLFLYGENEINYYIGDNLLTEDEMAAYAEKLNTLKALCDEKGKQLYMIFPANKSQVCDWLMPTIEVETDYKRTERLVDYLTENTSVSVNYLLDECKKWENEGPFWMTYYPYDTHWNKSGAFCGTMALYNMMGIETADPTSWGGESLGAPDYDLAVMAGIDVSTLGSSTEYVVNYKDYINVEGLDTEADVCRTTADCGGEDKLVLIGDSFRKNMEEYISKDFANCTFAHRDNIDEIDDDILESNIIVIETVERQDYEAFDVVDYLIKLLQ